MRARGLAVRTSLVLRARGARRAVTGGVILASLLIGGGCAKEPLPPPKFAEFTCEEWADACKGCGGDKKKGDVGLVLHVMRSQGVDHTKPDPNAPWKIAPKTDAVLDYWTVDAIDRLVGADGIVNRVWEPAQIRLSLRRVEKCTYQPARLRPDGRSRDSMPVPESYVPWASDMFRSINRLFTLELLHPDDAGAPAAPRARGSGTSTRSDVVHVVIWWSISERDAQPDRKVFGYARSAAYGGPAVWMDVYGCYLAGRNPPQLDYECAGKVLAHEIGHVFGLQHVDDACATMNLMYFFQPSKGVDLTPEQAEYARREARQQFSP